MFRCNKCKNMFEADKMHKHKDYKSGYDCCKVCHSSKTKLNQKKNPNRVNKNSLKWDRANTDKRRDTYYRRKYGISLEQYNEMHKKQDGCCALCGKLEKLPKSRLGVDHCHDTGRIRGLLCDLCNTALGRLGDSPKALERVVLYLKGDQYGEPCSPEGEESQGTS